MSWESAGFTPGTPSGGLSLSDKGGTVLERLLRSGGLLGDGAKGGEGSIVWSVSGKDLLASKGASAGDRFTELPQGWLKLDAAKKEAALLACTVDLNALRLSGESLFDAPWLQRVLDRLALNNARLVSLRGALCPAPSDNLPPLLELKAVASARSVAPGTALKPVTLVSPGWGGSNTEAAGVQGANWAASLRTDAGGLGQIGRDGGVGTMVGLIRLAVDLVGTTSSNDAGAWEKEYASWLERSGEPLRSLGTRLQTRATLACYGSASAPSLVLIIPARKGERVDVLTKAMEQVAATGGVEFKKGVWSLKSDGPAVPRLSWMVCDTATGLFIVASVERDEDRSLMQQTASRLRLAK